MTTLYPAPTAKMIRVMIPIQAWNTTTRPKRVDRRPGRWVNTVFNVPARVFGAGDESAQHKSHGGSQRKAGAP